MIVAAQRAYAERKTCMVRLEELKRELKTDAAQWEALMESCDAEMDALDEECAQREKLWKPSSSRYACKPSYVGWTFRLPQTRLHDGGASLPYCVAR